MTSDPGLRAESESGGSENRSDLLVFTATYNEADNIGEWLRRVTETVPNADLLIVDDGSPDGTADMVREFGHLHRGVHIIERPGKQGLGSAHKVAFDYALEHGYLALITMDADLSHEPESIPSFTSSLIDSDFVIGTRWGDGTCEYTGFRKIVSWLGNWSAGLLLRAPVSEYTTSYRAFSVKALRVLMTNPPQDDGYAFFMEVVIDLHRSGVRLAEVPITFKDRAGGESKIPKGQIAVSTLRLLQKAVNRRAPVDTH